MAWSDDKQRPTTAEMHPLRVPRYLDPSTIAPLDPATEKRVLDDFYASGEPWTGTIDPSGQLARPAQATRIVLICTASRPMPEGERETIWWEHPDQDRDEGDTFTDDEGNVVEVYRCPHCGHLDDY